MGRLDGKVAVVSGAARGQGRAHATTLAREGADVVIFDVCAKLATSLSPAATEEELAETAELVRGEGRRCLAAKVDARDLTALTSLADRAVAELGQVDLLVVNHGIWTVAANTWELEEEAWQESVDILLTAAWKVTKAFIPKMLEVGPGGAMVLTSSINGYMPQPSAAAYCAAKAGVLGLMRVLAWELGEHGIRVNAVCPGGVDTKMVMEGGTLERALELRPRFHNTARSILDVELLPPQSVADAVAWLLSSEARHVTGIQLPVDAGWSIY
jgi:(+)-trans-carveol dehydrogenase